MEVFAVLGRGDWVVGCGAEGAGMGLKLCAVRFVLDLRERRSLD